MTPKTKSLREMLEDAGVVGDPAKVFDVAAAVCSTLANYIEKTEPYAVNPIRSLREAADVLSGQEEE